MPSDLPHRHGFAPQRPLTRRKMRLIPARGAGGSHQPRVKRARGLRDPTHTEPPGRRTPSPRPPFASRYPVRGPRPSTPLIEPLQATSLHPRPQPADKPHTPRPVAPTSPPAYPSPSTGHSPCDPPSRPFARFRRQNRGLRDPGHEKPSPRRSTVVPSNSGPHRTPPRDQDCFGAATALPDRPSPTMTAGPPSLFNSARAARENQPGSFRPPRCPPRPRFWRALRGTARPV